MCSIHTRLGNYCSVEWRWIMTNIIRLRTLSTVINFKIVTLFMTSPKNWRHQETTEHRTTHVFRTYTVYSQTDGDFLIRRTDALICCCCTLNKLLNKFCDKKNEKEISAISKEGEMSSNLAKVKIMEHYKSIIFPIILLSLLLFVQLVSVKISGNMSNSSFWICVVVLNQYGGFCGLVFRFFSLTSSQRQCLARYMEVSGKD